MNGQQMVMAGRCRECGAKGHTPHTDECKWIGGVCEYQLEIPLPVQEQCRYCDAPTDFPSCPKCRGPHNPLVACTGPDVCPSQELGDDE